MARTPTNKVMENLIARLRSVVENSTSQSQAILNVAYDLGIQLNIRDVCGIFEADFPEEFSLLQFRNAIASGIVRYFDPSKRGKDVNRIPALQSAYGKLASQEVLTAKEIQSYHTMMFLLHPQPARTSDTVGDRHS